MAIRYFYGRYIFDKFSHCIVSGFNLTFYAGCFDFNSLVHNNLNYVEENLDYYKNHNVQKVVIDRTKENIKEIVANLKVNNTLLICTDGLVPQSKMNDQRARRYEFEEPIESINGFYRSSITPGTAFMKELRVEMKSFLRKEPLAPEIIYSDDLVIGEGEQKIMHYFRQWAETNGKENYVIYGLDADLILLCLLSPLKNIYIKRDEKNKYLNIDMLRKSIIKEFSHSENKSENIINDFIILTFFIGNDFIKRIPYFSDLRFGMDFLTDVYKDNNLCLTKKGEIKYSELRRLFRILYKEEDNIMSYAKRQKYDIHDYTDDFSTDWYDRCFLPRNDKILKKLNLEIYYDESSIKGMVDNYIEMFYWIFSYYTKGMDSVSFNFCYNYLYPPLFREIYKMMDKTEDEYTNHTLGSVIPSIATQMIYVLPPSLSELVEKKIRRLYNSNKTSYMFPTKGHIDKDTNTEIIYTFDVIEKLDDIVRKYVGNTYNHTTENDVYKHAYGIYRNKTKRTAMINAKGGYVKNYDRRMK